MDANDHHKHGDSQLIVCSRVSAKKYYTSSFI